MTTMKQDPMMLGAVLIVGALIYSKYAKAGTPPIVRNGGAGSMPGSAGTGLAQGLGGMLGNLFAGARYGNTATGAPNAQSVMDNINFFKQNPVNDTISTPDWNSAMADNPDLMANVTQFGV